MVDWGKIKPIQPLDIKTDSNRKESKSSTFYEVLEKELEKERNKSERNKH